MVVLLNLDFPSQMLENHIGKAWHEVIGEQSAAHFKHGCFVEKCYNTSGPKIGRLMTYLSKYVSKEADDSVVCDDNGVIADVGRAWGVWGKLPLCVVTGSMSRDDYAVFLRRLRRWSDNRYAKRLSVKWSGWLLFCDGAALLHLLRGLPSVKFERVMNT